MANMPPGHESRDVPSPLDRMRGLAELHLARTDLQAIVQGAFMEELLGLPRVTAELDRIDGLIDELASSPDGEVSDEAITVERDRYLAHLAADLKLTWPWFVQQLQIGFWGRQQLVEAEQRRADNVGQPPSVPVPGWPPRWTRDRRVIAVGGSPWAMMNLGLAPRFAMKRGDSLDALERRWQEISAGDALVDIARGTPGVIASRMTGAGFGDYTANLVWSDAVDRVRDRIEAEYPARSGCHPRVSMVQAVAGASEEAS